MIRYRINEIKLNLGEDVSLLSERIASKINSKRLSSSGRVKPSDIQNVEIVRRSIDARKGQVVKVFTADFDCDKKLKLDITAPFKYDVPRVTSVKSRPVVVGFGPCGMFAALVLARAGLKPIVLERGDDVETRMEKVEKFWKKGNLDTESNVQFGEGGAGTFSDGKLNTGIKDPRARFVLETFAEKGADKDILIDGRPHIGTDALREIVKKIREEIISLGGEVKFGCRLVGLILEKDFTFKNIEDEQLCGDIEGASSFEDIDENCLRDQIDGDGLRKRIKIRGINYINRYAEEKEEYLRCDNVVLALGHSARDTVRMLYEEGLLMEPKAFSMGVRVQHPQDLIDKGLYGSAAGHPELPPAYYKLATKVTDGRGVYSFCMCPGGEIVNAASQAGGVVTNGMSNHDRDSGFANSGILVDVRPTDYIGEWRRGLEEEPKEESMEESKGESPQCLATDNASPLGGVLPEEEETLAGLWYQEKYERLAFINGGSNYSIPTTTWGEYRDYKEEAQAVIDSLPDFVARDILEAMPIFGRKIKGFDNDDTVIKAIESRSSSPIRMLRDKDSLQGMLSHDNNHIINGLYPGGEGAGYAGGITSAACDGMKLAEEIIKSASKESSSDTLL